MKELVIVSTEIREENETGFFKVIKFTFNGVEGTLTNMNICGMEINDVSYNLGYASWNGYRIISQNTFSKADDDIFHYSDFINAFKNKFGIEIPLK